MKPTLSTLALGLVAILAGCGTGATTSTPSGVAVKSFKLMSTALDSKRALSARYACDPRAGLPPLEWGALPPNTVSVAVGVFELSNVHKTPQGTFVASISPPKTVIAGLSAKIHALAPHKLPRGATTGPGRYSFCPAKGSTGSYLIRVFALSRALPVAPGFNEAAFIKEAIGAAVGVGSLPFHYLRL